jgi:hypothetical protein
LDTSVLTTQERAVFEGALKVYGDVIGEIGNDPSRTLELARAHRRLGDVQRILNRFEEAELSYHQASNLLTSSATSSAETEFERKRELVTNLRNHGFSRKRLRNSSTPRPCSAE